MPLDELGLDQKYKITINSLWEEAKKTLHRKYGLSVETLYELASNFVFDQKSESLDKDAIAYLLGNRPKRIDSVYNLCALMGIFLVLGVMKQDTIENFIETYKSKDILTTKGRRWDDVYMEIEEGAVRIRTVLDALPQAVKPFPSVSRRIIHRRWILMLIGSGLFIPLIVLIFSLIPKQLATCLASYPASTPTFLRDQGLYLFQANDGSNETILSNSIRTTKANKQGLWIGYGTADGEIDRVSYYDDQAKTWTHCGGLHLTKGQTVNYFAFKSSSVFIATDGAGIVELSQSGSRTYTQDHDGLFSNSIYGLSVDPEGSVSAATYEGLFELVGQNWKAKYRAENGQLACNHVHRYLVDNKLNRWFAMVNCGISLQTPQGNWHSYYVDVPGFQNARSIVEDDHGGIWFATDGGGVLRFSNGQPTIINDNLPTSSVRDIAKDRFGRIWIATDKGVFYTVDLGKTWVVHSTMDTIDIEFGCTDCAFDDDHLALALIGKGLGIGRIPPNEPTVEYVSTPSLTQILPGSKYKFEVVVKVLSGVLSKGDGLIVSDPVSAALYGLHEVIPVLGDSNVGQGKTYAFKNDDSPIIAPYTPGKYHVLLRVWQGGRYVTEPLLVEFEVVKK